jgi:hypothetical protein
MIGDTKSSPPSATTAHEPPRLVMHADCTTCGRVNRAEDEPHGVVDIALDHTDGTGHIVVLNGTTDLPDEDWDTPALVATAPVELPTIEEILADPSASFWLRNALLAAVSRDPVDAANDADVLARLLDKRCREILEAKPCR